MARYMEGVALLNETNKALNCVSLQCATSGSGEKRDDAEREEE